jgi:hypothetical protein
MNRSLYSLVACSAVLTIAAGATTVPSMRDVLTAAYALRDLSGVDLSPAGDAVAWQESFHDPARLLQSPRWDSVYVRQLNGGARVRLTAGKPNGYYDEENPVWSLDGSAVAFV